MQGAPAAKNRVLPAAAAARSIDLRGFTLCIWQGSSEQVGKE